jgi:hypothetical protein
LSPCISSFGGDFCPGGCEIVGFVEVRSGSEKRLNAAGCENGFFDLEFGEKAEMRM